MWFQFWTLQAWKFTTLLFKYKILAQFKKFHKLDAITSISRKIKNHIKFQKPNYPDFIYNYEELSGSKREFRGTWSENALFFQNFIKS